MKTLNYKNWEKETRELTLERDFKEICRNILHNELHIKRLMTNEGAKDFDGNVIEEISKTEQFILQQKSELEFLKNIIDKKL